MSSYLIIGTALSALLFTQAAKAESEPETQIADKDPDHHVLYLPADVVGSLFR